MYSLAIKAVLFLALAAGIWLHGYSRGLDRTAIAVANAAARAEVKIHKQDMRQ